jgi:hypothetical protein
MYWKSKYLIIAYTSGLNFRIKIPHCVINKYIQDVSVNKAKGLLFPSIRGTLLPSFDVQCEGGLAINWLYLRVKFIPEVDGHWC